MLSVRIIPCLDVKAGRVVKGVQFESLRDAGDPVDCARAYEKQGADELVFLDITASSDGRAIMRDVVERTADQVFMPLTVGGEICGYCAIGSCVAAIAPAMTMMSETTMAKIGR